MTTFLPDLRPAPRLPVPADEGPTEWVCVNCDEPNVGRRRRCHDCGTTRD